MKKVNVDIRPTMLCYSGHHGIYRLRAWKKYLRKLMGTVQFIEMGPLRDRGDLALDLETLGCIPVRLLDKIACMCFSRDFLWIPPSVSHREDDENNESCK